MTRPARKTTLKMCRAAVVLDHEERDEQARSGRGAERANPMAVVKCGTHQSPDDKALLSSAIRSRVHCSVLDNGRAAEPARGFPVGLEACLAYFRTMRLSLIHQRPFGVSPKTA
jgi:hypothetical protein